METTTDTGTLRHDETRSEEVAVRHLYADNWQAFFDRKWRTVHVTEKRLYIKHGDKKITIEIFGI